MSIEGTVKWFSDQKGYGYVTKDDGSGDVFVHYSEIQTPEFKTLKEGETVSFDIEKTPKGEKAVKVVKQRKIKE